MAWMRTLVAASLASVPLASGFALVIDPGMYELHNHPDGVAAPPLYGLRLNELFDVTGDTDVFTFDFDEPGASMMLDYDGSSFHIYGTVYGGLNSGAGYSGDPNYVGFWNVDFTYNTLLGTAAGDDDLVVLDPGGNTGSLTRVSDNYVIDLSDFSNGDYTFRLGDDLDNTGHRGYSGISGWGWLSSDDQVEGATGDFLFTAVAVPEPGTYLMLGSLLCVVGYVRKKKSREMDTGGAS